MKTTSAFFPLSSALLLGLATTASLSAADPTSASIGPATTRRNASPYLSAITAPANATLDTAKSAAPAEATSTVASSTLSPFIARPAPASNVAASLDTTKTTNPADKPQYVFTWFLNNYLGTTIASSNAAEEIAEIETDAFGAPLARGTLPADMRYTGKPYDEDMGAYIFPARNYRPEEMCWMSADPSGFPDGTNNHAYCTNPLTQIDPMGLSNTATISFNFTGTSFTSSLNGGTKPVPSGQSAWTGEFTASGGSATLNYLSTLTVSPVATTETVSITATAFLYLGADNSGTLQPVASNTATFSWIIGPGQNGNGASFSGGLGSLDFGSLTLTRAKYTAEVIANYYSSGSVIVGGSSPTNSDRIFTTFTVE